jgi:hypothetical protein
VNWFRSYLTCRYNSFRIAGCFPSHSNIVQSGVPQALPSGPYCSMMSSTTFPIPFRYSTEDFKYFPCFINVKDRKLLQSDIDCVRKWCLNNGRNLSFNINTFISFNLRKNTFAARYTLRLTHPLPLRRVLKTLGYSQTAGCIITIMSIWLLRSLQNVTSHSPHHVSFSFHWHPCYHVLGTCPF